MHEKLHACIYKSDNDQTNPVEANVTMARRTASSITKDSFRKRKSTMIRKAHELVVRYGASVHLVIHFNGKFYVYDSGARAELSWPPMIQDIVRSSTCDNAVMRDH